MVHYILGLSVGDFGARSVDLIGIISAFEDTKTAHGLSQFSTSSHDENDLWHNSQQLNDLSDELSALIKQQSDARLMEVFIRMTKAEIEAFDLRQERISKIHVILSEHDAKR